MSTRGLSVAINPELATARDIERLIQVPSALDVDTFAKEHDFIKNRDKSIKEHYDMFDDIKIVEGGDIL